MTHSSERFFQDSEHIRYVHKNDMSLCRFYPSHMVLQDVTMIKVGMSCSVWMNCLV